MTMHQVRTQRTLRVRCKVLPLIRPVRFSASRRHLSPVNGGRSLSGSGRLEDSVATHPIHVYVSGVALRESVEDARRRVGAWALD